MHLRLIFLRKIRRFSAVSGRWNWLFSPTTEITSIKSMRFNVKKSGTWGRGVQSPGASSPWRLKFVWWCQILMGFHHRTCFAPSFWRVQFWGGRNFYALPSYSNLNVDKVFTEVSRFQKLSRYRSFEKLITFTSRYGAASKKDLKDHWYFLENIGIC
jgi:hypothetical protein